MHQAHKFKIDPCINYTLLSQKIGSAMYFGVNNSEAFFFFVNIWQNKTVTPSFQYEQVAKAEPMRFYAVSEVLVSQLSWVSLLITAGGSQYK